MHYRKKKLHDLTIFCTRVHRKKKYTTYRKKKLHDVTILSYTRLPQKKNTRPYRKEKITNYTENACLYAMCPPVGHF